MFVESSSTTIRGKTYTRHLLRRSYREDGKIKHETLGNVSRGTPEEIEAIRLALKHKGRLAQVLEARPAWRTRQGLSIGALWTVLTVARRLGIDAALGPTRSGRLALWQVVARVLDQGSRLSAVRLAGSHAACEALSLEAFNEEDLYPNLDWLAEKQPAIEARLFRSLRPSIEESGLFLYDVTSSYLEGTQNELAAFGYNRDKKKGKMQVVIGLLTTAAGVPVSIEVFEGATTDPQTFVPQIRKALERFGAKDVTFVGDRGMIKAPQIQALQAEGFHYITALTKPQILKLLRQGTLQMDLFDEEVAEVRAAQGARYVLRRNPVRAAELAETRADKLATVRALAQERSAYLQGHSRAQAEVALRKVQGRAAQLGIDKWTVVAADPPERQIAVTVDEAALADEAQLDGCYALTTDLKPALASAPVVHDRYKDLTLIEQTFRTCKTGELDVRPIFVRKAARTRAHALVVMLAYRIAHELYDAWRDFNLTVQEGLDQLAQLCLTDLLADDQPLCCQVPEPRADLRDLLQAARVQLPDALPARKENVTTKRKLPERRKKA